MEPMAVSPPAAGQPWTPRTGWGGQWGTPLASNPGGSRTSWPQTVTPPPAQARLWGTPPPPPGRDAPVAATPPPPSTIAGAYNAMDAAWVPPFSGVGSQNQLAIHAEHYPRRWVDAPRDGNARARFAVATLNLEADAAKSAGHSNGRRDGSRPAGEDWEAAFAALDQALVHLPDVLCLQEMQRCTRHNCPHCASGRCSLDHASMLHAKLLGEGFDGDYKRDGRPLTVGLYVRARTFTLESKVRTVRFASGKGAVLAVARHLGTGQRVALGSAHLEVPLRNGQPMTKAQVASAAQLQAALASYWGRAAVPLPVIVAGDFNTLSYKHWDPRIAPPDAFEQLTSPKPSAKKRAGADRGACRLPLRSAYADVQGAEPCYTSVDPAFPHCIDYVFYNGCGVLRPSRVLGVIDRKQQLPQAPWPSDHLCLVAAFDLTGAGPSPCKFGDRCRFFARGCCRNYHPQVPIEPLGEHNWYY